MGGRVRRDVRDRESRDRRHRPSGLGAPGDGHADVAHAPADSRDGVHAAGSRGSRRYRGAATPLGAFIAVVGLSLALRAEAVGPFASLLGAGKLKDKDKILVADFTANGDSTLGAAASEAVRADLGQSPIISIVTPQTVAGALQRMQRAPGTRVDTARRARDRADAKGSRRSSPGDIHAVTGGGFLVTMRLAPADTDATLASLSAGASSVTDLIPTIGKLTHQLRGKMGESLKHLQSSSELAQVTTASLPALQKFTEASHLMNVDQDLDKAIPLFKEAIALDTTFASAYRALAIALSNSGRDRAGQISALEKAYAHRDHFRKSSSISRSRTYYTQGPKPDLAKARAGATRTCSRSGRRSTRRSTTSRCCTRRTGSSPALKACSAARSRRIRRRSRHTTTCCNTRPNKGKWRRPRARSTHQLKASGNNPRVAMDHVNFLWSRTAYDVAAAYADSVSAANPAMLDLIGAKIGVEKAVAATRGQRARSAAPRR